MDCTFTQLPYGDTGFFSRIATSYVEGDEKLKPYIKYPVSVEGIKAAINDRNKFPTDRKLLVTELHKQYEPLHTHAKVKENINLLSAENTYTITTAHQP